ncbi:MAG: EAL domain-containing protein, partial [Gammaproteobacteria bacterium]|nr:EAL domain-containing protein [Gammaproteobacteria bacterium]
HLFKEQDEKYSSQQRDVGWLQKLQNALENDGFVLTRQPILAVESNSLAFYEARACLKDADGLIAPSVFLPIAERFDLAVAIDEWVIDKVIANIVVQRQQGEAFRHFIHLSQQTLFYAPLYDLIRTKIKEFSLDPELLIFEVREAVAMADLRATETLFRRLQKLGCKTALDDFGAGMSAFTYLKTMPVDYVKIEGRFARNLAKEKSDQVIMQAIQNIVAVYGKHTICKFIETKNCLDVIKKIGINYAQGYFVGRPKLDETK